MRVLFIGEDPESAGAVNDPAIPKDITPEKIQAGIAKATDDMRARGWDPVFCAVKLDPAAAAAAVREALASGRFDCAVIGGGVRLPASRVPLLETLVNLLRREAPDTAVGFNTGPETTPEAVERVTGA